MFNINLDNIKRKIELKYGTIEEKPFVIQQSVEKFVKNNIDIKQIFDLILQKYPNIKNYYNIMNLIRYNLDPDVILFCKMCHKPLKLQKGVINKDRSIYCSTKCLSNDPEIIQKRGKTNLKLYGGVSVMDSPILRDKAILTNRNKFGTDFSLQNKKIQNKCHLNINFEQRTQNYIKNLQEKYGNNITNISQLPEIKIKKKKSLIKHFGSIENGYNYIHKKVENTTKKRFGVKTVLLLEKNHQLILNKSWNNMIQSWKKYIIPLFEIKDWKGYNKQNLYKWKCTICGHEFQQIIKKSRFSKKLFNNSYIPRCPKCYPPNPNRSALEINVYNYVCKVYKQLKPDADIEKEVLHNKFDVIPPKQLDIYLPKLNLAFQVDGTYWHDEKFKGKDYHQNKDKQCAQKNILLSHIKEENWNNNITYQKNKILQLILNKYMYN